MSSILPLGRTMNFGRSASGGNVRFSLRDVSGVAFVVDTPANASTLTITEQNAASGGTSQALAGGAAGTLTFVYTQTNGVWTQVTSGISANVVTVAGTPDLLYVWVPQGALSDGFSYLSGNHSAKAITAVMGDIDVQRKPSNLRDVRA
jgi:hypothetical protein